MKVWKPVSIIFIICSLALTVRYASNWAASPYVRNWAARKAIGPIVPPTVLTGSADTEPIAHDFLWQCHYHDYNRAHKLLTANQQSLLTVQALQQQWKALEQKCGAIKKWKGITGKVSTHHNVGIGSTQTYVDRSYQVQGAKGNCKVEMRLVFQNNVWGVQSLKIQP